MTQPPQPISYQSQFLGEVSGMAKASMILGIIAIPTSIFGIGILLGILALILGIISLNAINKSPGLLGGKGFALTGIITGAIASILLVPLLLALFASPGGRGRELANRTACAANLNGVLKAMVVYSSDNADNFPLQDGTVRTSSISYNLGSMYMLTTAAGGSAVSTKSFMCKSDLDISTAALATQSNFNTPPAGRTAGQSRNHQYEGQNVAFGDAHSEWQADATRFRNGSAGAGGALGQVPGAGTQGNIVTNTTRNYTAGQYTTNTNPQKPTPGNYIFK